MICAAGVSWPSRMFFARNCSRETKSWPDGREKLQAPRTHNYYSKMYNILYNVYTAYIIHNVYDIFIYIY